MNLCLYRMCLEHIVEPKEHFILKHEFRHKSIVLHKEKKVLHNQHHKVDCKQKHKSTKKQDD